MKLLLLSALVWCSVSISSQTNSTFNTQQVTRDGVVINPESIPVTFLGESAPLSDYAGDHTVNLPITKPPKLGLTTKNDWFINPSVNPNALPQVIDPILQKHYNTQVNKATQVANFDGMPTETNPGDPALDVGPNHIVQMLNGASGAKVQIWSKTAPYPSLLGPADFSAMVGLPNAGLGDPIVLYDQRADRWFLTEFCSGCNDLYIAISTTPDPTGTYNIFTVAANQFPDYPKYSIWDNTYLITANEQANGGNASSVYALDRTSMLAGTAANAQRFTIPRFGTIGFQLATPVSLMGTTVSGTPPMLMRVRDDAWAGAATDALEIWELNINWTNPGAATLAQTSTLAISPHESEFCGYTSFSCIPQPGGANLDPLREIIMNRAMYRNFGTHESIVCAHVTDVNSSLSTGLPDWAGIRWYELRRVGGGTGTWTIYQEGTYAPDSDHRWMPTIGISASGNIGLGYNVSSSTTHPDIRYTGRKECDPLGMMTEAEVVLVDGTAVNNANRWGDYNSMGVDPTDGETFWYTAMYNVNPQASTRIGAFSIAGCNPTVQFSSSIYTVNEPDANVANGCLPYYVLNVPISIGVDPSQPANITVNVTGGTATQGVDYVINNTTFVLDNPNLSAIVQIWVYNDDYVEGPETITLGYTLNANGGNATTGLNNQTVTVTINDDDLPPSLMVTTSTVLLQDFETGMAPFTTINNAGGGGNLPWQIGNVAAASSGFYTVPNTNATQFAYVNDDACNCNMSDVDLIFPVLDLSLYTAATLNFDAFYRGRTYQGNTETANLLVSINGAPYTNVSAVILNDAAWTNQTINLTPYVGNVSVQFKFNYSDGTGWLYGCSIDNILITGAQPISIQTSVNTGAGKQANLGPNSTVHFYDPLTSDVMMTIVNTSAFDYGCITVEVDRDGSTPTALQFATIPVVDYLHSKTYTVTPTNSNPTGTFDVTLYYKEAEVATWETITGNSRVNAEVIKVAGNNTIAGVNPGNFTTFTINNVLAAVGAFNTGVTFTSSFTNGFSGFGVGIYNITTVTVIHTVVNTNLTCNGDASGSIVVTATGGTAPYSYSIDGGSTFQVSNTFSGLIAGTYSVLAQDAGGSLSIASSEVITEPIVVTYTSTLTNLTCNLSADGQIVLLGAGGTGPYTYSIDGGITFQATGSFIGQSAGVYSVIVQDANLCQTTGTVTLTEPTVVTYTSTLTNLTCNLSADGQIVLLGAGGTGPYTYSIDGGLNFQATGSFIGQSAGVYSVIVQDANLCQTTGTVTLTEPTVVTYTPTLTNLTCNLSADGQIVLLGAGGTGLYTYSIDGGLNFQATGTFIGLSAGVYPVVVQDANLCQTTGNVTLTEPTVVTYTSTTTNITCNGLIDGVITLTGAGGSGTFQYSIDGGITFQSSGTFISLGAATYSIVVEDAAACQASGLITITEPIIVSHTSAFTNLNCNLDASGTITLTGSGGSGLLQYSIDGGVNFQSSGVFTGLSAGTYSIVVSDVNTCQSTEVIILTEPAATSYTSTLANVTCNAGTDGQIILSGAGGTSPFQYSIDGGSTFQVSTTFTGVSAGTYNVIAQDTNGCQAIGVEVITEPTGVIYTNTLVDPTCNGGADGSITFIASGGVNPLSFSIDGGTTYQSSVIFSSLLSGSFSVAVSDGNNCVSNSVVVLTDPVLISYTTSATPESCGLSDGTISFNASGGTGALQYSIDGGITFQTSNLFIGVTAGIYNTMVQDANGCQVLGTQNVASLGGATITSALNTNPTCNGNADAGIIIIATGGSAPLQYSIDGGITLQATGIFTGLVAGVYSVVVQDASGCQTSATVTIIDPALVSYTAVVADESCGLGNGAITITGTGGTGTLQYSIDGGTTFQPSSAFIGLTASSYSIVVQDLNSCQVTGTVLVNSIAGPTVNTVTATDPSCNGASNGSLFIAASGGSGTLQYSIDGGTTFQASATFTGLTFGTYSIVVNDAGGCQVTSTSTLIDPVILSTTSTVVNVSCNGGSDGSVAIIANGGTSPYQYSIDGGVNFVPSSSFIGLVAGTYAYLVQDNNGCQVNGSAIITEPSVLILTFTSTSPLCNGDLNGTITMTASGGNGFNQFSIDGGTTFQGASTFTGLAAGTYNLVIMDVNGCQAFGTESITEPLVVSYGFSTVPLSCNGANDGLITLTGTGGTGTIQYSIDGGVTFQNAGAFTGLAAGTYSVVVEDGNACQATGSIIITEPLVITLATSFTNPNCNGANDGTITLSTSGGTGGIQYSIDGGTTFQVSGSFTGLISITYNVVAVDANGCQVTSSITLVGPTGMTYSVIAVDENCGQADGGLIFTVSGGVPPYQYSVDGGITFQSSNLITGLTAGSYNSVIQDGNGCQISGVDLVNSTSGFTIASTSFTEPLCNGGSDATATIVASGGTPPIQYSIDGGITFQTSNLFSNLFAGTQNVVVQDGSGCQVTTTIVITEPTAISYSAVTTTENCGLSNGSLTITASGGTTSLQYSIDGGITFQTSGSFTGITSGSYNIVVEDVNGCQTTGVEVVTGSGGATISNVVGTDPLCAGNNDGEITISASGGVAPLQYSIDGGTTFQSSNFFNGLIAGVYAITVEDASGCQNSSTVTLSAPLAITYSVVITDENCGAIDGSLSFLALGGNGIYQFSIDGGITFQASSSFNGISAGTYSILIIDGNTCQVNGSEIVNGVGGATITSVISTDASCFGVSDGGITITATGGVTPLLYSIDGGGTFQSSGSFATLLAGNYNVVVEDANGCQELATVSVNSPSQISVIVAVINATCGNNDGGASVTVTGGNGTYTYQWDDVLAQTTPSAINLNAGVYNLVVTDGVGCSTSVVVLVNNIGEPDLTLSSSNVSCYGYSDGTALSIVVGGIAPLTYQWNDVNTQTTTNAFNLSAGTYILQVTDAVGCIAVGTVNISQPDSLIVSILGSNTTCGFDNGVGMASIVGGTSPYSLLWDDFQSQITNAAINLAAGNYTINVIDANNCQATDSISIASSDSLVVTVSVIHESCLESSDGSIQTAVTGGLDPYSYLWSNEDTTAVASLLTMGNYFLTVSDANNCSITLLIPIETLGENCISIPTAISPNGDGSNDVWNITGLQDYPETTVEIYNRWGALLYSATNYQNDWNGTFNGKNVPAGVYYFIVKVSQGEVYTGSLTILR